MKEHLFFFLMTLLSIQVSYAQCDNVTSSGSITADQVVCADNPDPAPILNAELPGGGSGDLEFLWISTMQDPNSSTAVWFPIAGSTADSYDPDPISQTTYYRRCARRTGCTQYIGESNIITIEYTEECIDACDFFKVTVMATTSADCGVDNGTVNLSIVAGALPLSYNLNGEILSELPEDYAAGFYDLAVTDAEGCMDDVSFTIEGAENTVAVVGDTNNPVCQSPNGSIVLSISGGSGEYTALWNDGSTDINRENLLDGTYTVTITDENVCSVEKSFVLTMMDNDLAVSLDVTNASCANQDGGAEVIIEGGMPPYIIKLNSIPVSEISNLAPDTYIVTVTDINGCSVDTELVIEANESTISISSSITNPICTADNGSIALEINGNTGPVSVLWDFNNSEETTQNNLAAGDYSVIVTDENGCSISENFNLTAENNDLTVNVIAADANCGGTASASIEIENGIEPYTILLNGEATDTDALAAGDYTVNATDANGCTGESTFTIVEAESDIAITGSTVNPSCSNDTGAITISISGGTGNTSILWNDGNTDSTREGLAAGTYTITATDENGCSATENYELIIEESDLVLNLNLTDVSCNGGNDGGASFEIIGGTAPFVISLDGFEVTEISNLPAGEYTVSVVDALGCSLSVPFTIAQNPLVMIDANVQNPTCGAENGSIELILSGGTGNYTIVWDDNLSNDLVINNLAEGTYSLSVKDENDCIVSTQFTLTGESSGLEAELAITNTSCNGTADGSVIATINNGTPPYLFTLNGLEVLDLNNLAADDYNLETTDLTGCSVTNQFTISEPSAIEITGTTSNPTCGFTNGSISLNITGGTADADENYAISWTEGDGTNLTAGDYSVTVTDSNGCTGEATFSLSDEGSDLEIVISTTGTTCSDTEDGTAAVTIVGGTEPYTYLLNGEAITVLPMNYATGDYTLTVTDVGGCGAESSFNIAAPSAIELSASISNTNCTSTGGIDLMVNGGTAPYTFLWSNDETTQNLSDIAAGEYFATVTDANGCTIANSEAYLVGNEGGGDFVLSVTTNDVNCLGGMDGTAIVNIGGGTAPYTYTLNGTEVSNLPMTYAAGDYILSAQDANGCSSETTFSISQPDTEISFTGIVEAASCGSTEGNILLSVIGGITPYQFLWSNNAETQNLNNIAEGSYTVTVTDANGCAVNNDDNPFDFAGNSNLSLVSNLSPTSCGENNGIITITVSQGTSPYQIVWNDGLTNDVLRTNLPSGDYSVTVTDTNGCAVSENFMVGSSVDFSLSITPIDASCNSMDDGAINMSFAGGTPPFVYILNGQSMDDLPSTLPSSDYQLQVFDAAGCSDLVEFSIGAPDEIIYLAEITDATCPGDFVSIEFTAVQGGSGTYTYLWSDDVTTLNRDDLTNGTYYLTITDTNGCTAVSEPFIANVPSAIQISADGGDFQNISCLGEEDGAVNITVTGGTPPYSYFWSNNATTEDIDNLAAGEYLLQLADANGCTTLFLAVISDPEALTASTVVLDATCMMSDGSASIWPLGGTQPYFFHWENGAIGAEELNLAPGNYPVTVSDFGGCEIIIDIEVGEMDCLESETGEEFSFVMNEINPDLENNSVEIHWMTEGEAIESFFIIQHSQDGEEFTDISGLLQGEGATQIQNEYYNTCLDMALGTHFFRIRYVDVFGNLRTSETMTTELLPDSKIEFAVFPNPTMDDFNISFLLPLDAPAQVQIVSAQAGIVENITAPIGTLHQQIDLRKYNPGVYFVIVEREGLRRLTKRIVKM